MLGEATSSIPAVLLAGERKGETQSRERTEDPEANGDKRILEAFPFIFRSADWFEYVLMIMISGMWHLYQWFRLGMD